MGHNFTPDLSQLNPNLTRFVRLVEGWVVAEKGTLRAAERISSPKTLQGEWFYKVIHLQGCRLAKSEELSSSGNRCEVCASLYIQSLSQLFTFNSSPDLSQLNPNSTPDLSQLNPNSTPNLSQLNPNFNPGHLPVRDYHQGNSEESCRGQLCSKSCGRRESWVLLRRFSYGRGTGSYPLDI